MKANARQAFSILKKMGAPVMDRTDGYGCEFLISAERYHCDDKLWCDYYQEEVREHWHPDDLDKPLIERRINNAWGIRTEVNEVLNAKALHAEWINPGLVGVYF